MDSDGSPSQFIDPQRLLTTGLGISVGVAWNAAIREIVDDFLPTDESTGALVSAVLVTVLAVIIWALANLFHTTLRHFTQGDPTPDRAVGEPQATKNSAS